MILHDIYAAPAMWWLPYTLLRERAPHESISHKTMPTLEEHKAFVRGKPYTAWYWFTCDDGHAAGCVYLSKQNEIGIGVLKAYRGQGLATKAVTGIMRLHPSAKFLANIAPENHASVNLFRKLGFLGPVQHTYVIEGAR